MEEKRAENEKKKRCTAVVLAAGSGKRMGSETAKQFMLLEGKPVIWYALQAVERSKVIDDCILVAGAEELDYMRQEIVEKYGFGKVDRIVPGGRERYESVYEGLCVIEAGEMTILNHDGYVFIHDGARPFLTEAILEETYRQVCRFRACAAAVPVKDTIKVADGEGFALRTPDRNTLWAMQTPQVFETELIIKAYKELFRNPSPERAAETVTDDAMVVEKMSGIPVKLVKTSYYNIKITTPEDMEIAGCFLRSGRAGGEGMQIRGRGLPETEEVRT